MFSAVVVDASVCRQSIHCQLTSMKMKRVVLAIATLCFSVLVQAQISVNRSVIEFSADDKIQDIEVANFGDHKVYLDLKAAEILNPESENPTRVELTDPRTSPLIVSPRQLVVPAGERRRMRVILRTPAIDKDRVFRLSVKPYAGSVKIDDAGGDKKASAIKVLVGYDLLLLSRPQILNPQVDVERTNDQIAFHNRGNTNVLLRKIEQCPSDGEQCVELQPNRLYAGESYAVNLPLKGSATQYPVRVWKAIGLENEKASY